MIYAIVSIVAGITFFAIMVGNVIKWGNGEEDCPTHPPRHTDGNE